MGDIRFAAAQAGNVPRAEMDASQRFVTAFSGPVLSVIGAPGSGKTTALVERVAALVDAGTSPDEILVLAPTRDAAALTRTILAARIPATRSATWARTPHALAFDVLRQEAARAGVPSPRLMTGSEQEQIIAELLAGRDVDREGLFIPVRGSAPEWPAHITPEIRRLRGFRHELRDLIARCTEHGVDAGRLRALGEQFDRSEWVAAAAFLVEYRDVLNVAGEQLLDSADVIERASRVVSDTGPGEQLAGVRHILIDDVQELTESTVALLRELVTPQTQLVTFGDPDAATNEFRGGLPELAADLPVRLGFDRNVHFLTENHRMPAAIFAAGQRITAQLGTALAGRQRRAVDITRSGTARAVVTPSLSQLLALVSGMLRRRHLHDGVPWSQMAVIVRTANDVVSLSNGLAAFGVPVQPAQAGVLARNEQASRQLLLASAVATGVRELDAATLTELLQGFIGGLDAIALRRLRRQLRLDELAAGGDRSADELLVAAAESGFGHAEALPSRRADRLMAILAHAREVADTGAGADDVLWTIWSDSGVAEEWRSDALSDGVAAASANHDLDSVIALFSVAARFGEQQPDAPAAAFVRTELEKTVADDVLAARAVRDVVWVGTPAQSLGRSFHTVVVSGVQEGMWPNLRPRDSLLGSNVLPDAVAGRRSTISREQTLAGELRMFFRAVSRATDDLLVVAINSEDDGPSTLLSMIDPDIFMRDELPVERVAAHPYTLRGMVGALRRELLTSDTVGARRSVDAAAGLARLARAGVPGADPGQWHGLQPPSTLRPLHDDDGAPHAVGVSPSSVEKFENCPLNWFLDMFGAARPSSATAIGTIIHSAFEKHRPGDPPDVMREQVFRRWGELQFEAPWQDESARRRAERIIGKTQRYLHERERLGAVVVAREAEFIDTFGETRLHGFIDRIERNPDGGLVIVDLKTGRQAPALAEMPHHPQLLCYQLAVADDSLLEKLPTGPIDQALLLLVGTDQDKPPARVQPGANAAQLEQFRRLLGEISQGMGAGTFVAEVEQHCDRVRGHVSCRLHIVKAVSA